MSAASNRPLDRTYYAENPAARAGVARRERKRFRLLEPTKMRASTRSGNLAAISKSGTQAGSLRYMPDVETCYIIRDRTRRQKSADGVNCPIPIVASRVGRAGDTGRSPRSSRKVRLKRDANEHIRMIRDLLERTKLGSSGPSVATSTLNLPMRNCAPGPKRG